MPRGPRFLEDFIIPALNSERYNHKLQWDVHEKNVFMLLWTHKTSISWHEEDTVVFQDWDRLKGRYNPKQHNYFSQAKQRFRAALHKLRDVFEEVNPMQVNRRISYRRYRILTRRKISKRKSKKIKKEPVIEIGSMLVNLEQNCERRRVIKLEVSELDECLNMLDDSESLSVHSVATTNEEIHLVASRDLDSEEHIPSLLGKDGNNSGHDTFCEESADYQNGSLQNSLRIDNLISDEEWITAFQDLNGEIAIQNEMVPDDYHDVKFDISNILSDDFPLSKTLDLDLGRLPFFY